MKQALAILMACVTCGCDTQTKTSALSGPVGLATPADTSHGYLGLMFESIDDVPLIVTGCVPGSGAESAGIQAEDALVSLNGQTSPSFERIHKIIADTAPGDVVVAVFKRGDEHVSIEFPLMSFENIQTAMEAKWAEHQASEGSKSDLDD